MKKLVLALILAAFIAPSAFAASGTATFTVNVTEFAAIEGLDGGSTSISGEAAYTGNGGFVFVEPFAVTANKPFGLLVECTAFTGSLGSIAATTCAGSTTLQGPGVSVPQLLAVGGTADAATLAGDYASTVTVTVSM